MGVWFRSLRRADGGSLVVSVTRVQKSNGADLGIFVLFRRAEFFVFVGFGLRVFRHLEAIMLSIICGLLFFVFVYL